MDQSGQDGVGMVDMIRHIDRVRVMPKNPMEFPDDEAFVERDGAGVELRYKLEKWIGYILLYYSQSFTAQYINAFDEIPFDTQIFKSHVERVMRAGKPWKMWALSIRSVYRWENPGKTLMWLAVYVGLWHTEHILAFLYAYVLYIVIKHRYYPTTVVSIPAASRPSMHTTSMAWQFRSLIDTHPSIWLEPCINEMATLAQLQIGDLANLLEVLDNFYHWRRPEKTAASLALIVTFLLFSLVVDVAACMKMVWLGLGLVFFFLWPVSSHFPRYRYLVSPLKWALWDIPTHAEWSFQYFRRKAEESRQKMEGYKVVKIYHQMADHPDFHPHLGHFRSPSALASDGNVSFSAEWQGIPGRLVMCPTGVCFLPGARKKEMWKLPFARMKEMRKLQILAKVKPHRKRARQTDHLEFKAVDGGTLRLAMVRHRNLAFNSIIGFSKLQWQSMHTRTGGKASNMAFGAGMEMA